MDSEKLPIPSKINEENINSAEEIMHESLGN